MLSLLRKTSTIRKTIKETFVLHKTLQNIHQPVRWKSTYKAAVLKEFNKPLVIESFEKNKNELKDGKLKIGIYYCSLNDTDLKLLSGQYPEKIELPLIPGYEFSGEILDVSKSSSKHFRIGDRVVALRGHKDSGGGLAGEAIVDDIDCWACDNVTLKESAILPYGHGTAMLAFSKYCPIDENDTVIVTAGSAGMGLAAIEVAASVFKAKVIAICDTDDSSDIIREEGAFNVICLKEGPAKIHKYLQATLNGKKAKVGYDAIGQGLLHLLDEFVDPINGHLISVDPFYNPEILKTQKLDYKKPSTKKSKDDEKQPKEDIPPIEERVKFVDLYKYRETDVEFYRQIITETLELCEDDLISAFISGTFKLSELEKAIDFIENKKFTGKVLIEIRDEVKKEKVDEDKKHVKNTDKDDDDDEKAKKKDD